MPLANNPSQWSLFVVGCDRSGTTLLTSILESGFGLAAPLETHVIPAFARGLWMWGDLERRAARRRLLVAMIDFLEILIARTYPTKSVEALEPVTLLAVRDRIDAMVDESRDFGDLILGWFGRFANSHGQTGWVDNSSFYESLPLEIWEAHLPQMRVIHIVRDGRDVALSWLKSWWGPATLGEAAWLWRRHVRDKRAWGLKHPGYYLEISYESLLTRPEENVARIAAFLNLPVPSWPVDLTLSASARALSSGGTHDLLRGPVKSDNREKWRTALSDRDQRLFEWFAADLLRASGYPTRFDPMSVIERLLLAPQAILSLGKRFFTPVFYAKKAKWVIPWILRLAGSTRGLVVRLAMGRKG
ncbi:MAG: sulfotransferase [Magnetococcales bacterium]|nr:sulfotransferase [Magnetococcales bacterium]